MNPELSMGWVDPRASYHSVYDFKYARQNDALILILSYINATLKATISKALCGRVAIDAVILAVILLAWVRIPAGVFGKKLGQLFHTTLPL